MADELNSYRWIDGVARFKLHAWLASFACRMYQPADACMHACDVSAGHADAGLYLLLVWQTLLAPTY